MSALPSQLDLAMRLLTLAAECNAASTRHAKDDVIERMAAELRWLTTYEYIATVNRLVEMCSALLALQAQERGIAEGELLQTLFPRLIASHELRLDES